MPFSKLFPDEDYDFQMRPRPSDPAAFFAPTPDGLAILEERRRWLRQAPGVYSAHCPEGDAALNETIQFARRWRTLAAEAQHDLETTTDPVVKCRLLGEAWQPDFLLLRPDPEGRFRLVSGCVCFPSSWALDEKMGKSLEEIHAVVPGLNASTGKAIHTFLTKMKPGTGWLRENWGLSASAERNQHPVRRLPKLAPAADPAEIFLRVEEQILCPLPESRGVLFGIRLRHHSLGEVWNHPEWRRRFERALETMPASMAAYKNLAAWRDTRPGRGSGD